MPVFAEDEALTNDFSDLIGLLPDPFYVEGKMDIPSVVIPKISDVPLKYPLTSSVITKIKSVTKPSPVGRGTKTVYDENIRKGYELDSSLFILKNFEIDSRKSALLNNIHEELSSHVNYIVAKPYKFLIYEKGGFFTSHVDTMMEDGHFGTLIISIPCEGKYAGGDFSLNYHRKDIKWDPNKNNWIAFYTNISHQISTVISGHRVCITFNLIIPKDSIKKQIPLELSIRNTSVYTQKVFEVANESLKKYDVPESIVWIIVQMGGEHSVVTTIRKLFPKTTGVCVIFSHRYAGEVIAPEMLKGRDVHLYELFSKYTECHISPLMVTAIVGKWSDEGATSENDYQGEIIESWDEKDPQTTWNIIIGKKWWDSPEWLKSGGNGDQSLFYSVFEDRQETLSAAELYNHGEESYGNVGTYNVENQYHCAGLVLLPLKDNDDNIDNDDDDNNNNNNNNDNDGKSKKKKRRARTITTKSLPPKKKSKK